MLNKFLGWFFGILAIFGLVYLVCVMDYPKLANVPLWAWAVFSAACLAAFVMVCVDDL